MKSIKALIRRKFLLVTILFLVWMLFFDKNNLIDQYKLRNQYQKILGEKEYYLVQIEQTSKDRDELFTNEKTLEKFAREKYMMKRDNEDVFIIVEED